MLILPVWWLNQRAHQLGTNHEGKYYLIDFGYHCTSGFLLPYQGEWYHLQEYWGKCNQPVKYKEFFNYRHSSLQNIIERYFAILKTQFSILRMMPCYKLRNQPSIVVACCTLDNWISPSTQMINYLENMR